MNWFKWVQCWWNKKHTYALMYDKEQTPRRTCVVCNYSTDV